MRIDAKHVRKKQLSSYLPASVLQRNKRNTMPLTTATAANGANAAAAVGAGGGIAFAQPRKRPSDAALDPQFKKVRTKETTDAPRHLEVHSINVVIIELSSCLEAKGFVGLCFPEVNLHWLGIKMIKIF